MIITSYINLPKSLRHDGERKEREGLLDLPNIRPLTMLVDRIRKERQLEKDVPYFDPCDGGVNARALFILEAPGKKAVKSGLISRNNDDETASNMLDLLKTAGLDRQDTILWNIIPWFLGEKNKIRAATVNDIKEGLVYLPDLLNLLNNLKAIVLVGKKAQKGFALYKEPIKARIFICSHPSPSNINSRFEARSNILSVFTQVAQQINK